MTDYEWGRAAHRCNISVAQVRKDILHNLTHTNADLCDWEKGFISVIRETASYKTERDFLRRLDDALKAKQGTLL